MMQKNQHYTAIMSSSSQQILNPASKLTSLPPSPFGTGSMPQQVPAQQHPSASPLTSPVHQSGRWTPRYNSVIMAGGDLVQVGCMLLSWSWLNSFGFVAVILLIVILLSYHEWYRRPWSDFESAACFCVYFSKSKGDASAYMRLHNFFLSRYFVLLLFFIFSCSSSFCFACEHKFSISRFLIVC